LLKDLHWLISFLPSRPTGEAWKPQQHSRRPHPSPAAANYIISRSTRVHRSFRRPVSWSPRFPGLTHSPSRAVLRPPTSINSPCPRACRSLPTFPSPRARSPRTGFAHFFDSLVYRFSRRCIPRGYALLIMAGYGSTLPLVAAMSVTDHGPAPD
jgi:hypothetical protein